MISTQTLIPDSVKVFRKLEKLDKKFERKAKLFNSLKTIEQKIAFWEIELGGSYTDFINFESENDFRIILNFKIDLVESEWLDFNKWILINYPVHNLAHNNVLYLDLDILKKELKLKIQNAEDKREIILSELQKINSSFLNLSAFDNQYQDLKFSFDYNSYYDSFKNLLEFEKEPDYAIIPSGKQTIITANGKTLAEYVLFLKEELKNNSHVSKSANSKTLSIKQIALIFYYTEILNDNNKDVTVKAKTLSSIFNIGYKKLYDSIREGGRKANKKDLEAVIDFLNNAGLKKFVKTVEIDFKKLRK